jgi:hypothetical protein
MEKTFKPVTITINQSTTTFDLIITELSLIYLIQSLYLHFTNPLLLIFHKLASIDIAITMVKSTLSPEVTISKLSNILLSFMLVSTMPIFLIIGKLPVIGSPICLFQSTLPMSLTLNKITDVLSILSQRSPLPLAMELIMLKSSLIFNMSSRTVNTLTMFFSISK